MGRGHLPRTVALRQRAHQEVPVVVGEGAVCYSAAHVTVAQRLPPSICQPHNIRTIIKCRHRGGRVRIYNVLSTRGVLYTQNNVFFKLPIYWQYIFFNSCTLRYRNGTKIRQVLESFVKTHSQVSELILDKQTYKISKKQYFILQYRVNLSSHLRS